MLAELLAGQAGVATRVQLRAAGLSDSVIQKRLAYGRWRRILPRTYATFDGPLYRDAQLWAAVLYAGPDAVLSHETAGELNGLVDEPTGPIQVTVPVDRCVAAQSGLVVHRSARALRSRHPARQPPRTRVEETVVDLTQSASTLERAVGWLTRAVGRRLTTPDRLLAALDERPKLRWRAEITAALGDAAGGCHSPLERVYLRRVERPHGLPAGRRQVPVSRPGGRRYDDVRYEAWGVQVELDGRAAHPDDRRWRDMARDNTSVQSGLRVLRYGWGDVTERPCDVAVQVIAVLRLEGWPGPPRRCGPGCPVTG